MFLTCHDLGQRLGCYGQSSVTSPALDGLAATGVRFARSFCTAPQCSPSRASLHTGRYPHSAGMLGLAHTPFGWRLNADTRHVAHLLAEAGYATTLIGMQHLTERDRAHELGYAQVLPLAPALEEADATLGVLRELAAQDRPFYVEVGFEEPHRPYDFGGARPDDSRGVAVPGYLPDAPETRQDLAAFQGAIRQMDAGVGRILRGLDALGLTETTCVVFATDHGAAMPRAKCTLYDPGIEVALLWRWPSAGVRGGRVVSELISNVDVPLALLDGLGLPPPPGAQGVSFWPLLQGGAYAPRSAVFAEKTFHTGYEPMRAVRTAGHKLIVNFEISTAVDVPSDIRDSPIYPLMRRGFDVPRRRLELYDLQADPWEQHNLLDQRDPPGGQDEPGPHRLLASSHAAAGQPDAAHARDLAEVGADLRRRLLTWMQDTHDPLLLGPVASPYYHTALAALTASA